MDETNLVLPEGKKLLNKTHTRANSVIPLPKLDELAKNTSKPSDRDSSRNKTNPTQAGATGTTPVKVSDGNRIMLSTDTSSYLLWESTAGEPESQEKRISSFLSSPNGRYLCIVY